MVKIIFNLLLLYLVYIYLLRPFFQGFMGKVSPQDKPKNNTQKTDEYTDYEEIK